MGKPKWKEEHNYRKTVGTDMERCSRCQNHIEYVAQDRCHRHEARVSCFGKCDLFTPKHRGYAG